MKKKPKILVAHGVNLDLLGQREAEHYGTATLDAINQRLAGLVSELAKLAGFKDGVELSFFQTNVEAEFLGKLSEGFDGAVINPAAWTHTSIALADRLRALGLPFVEAHLSNLAAREEFRHKSYAAPHARGVVFGLGFGSYAAALFGLLIALKDGR